MTLMACMEPQGAMDQEQVYTEALSKVAKYRLADAHLELLDASGAALLVYERLETFAGHPATLVGTEWQLLTLDGTPLDDTLREGGLRHVYELAEPDIPYTYVYQGESETLDHILVTPSLYARLARVAALHVNADFPLALPDDAAALKTSDHDPLVAVFVFGE